MLHGLTIVSDITMLCVKTSILICYINAFYYIVVLRTLAYYIMAIQAIVYLTTSGVTVSMLFLCADKISATHTFCAQNYNLVTAQRIFGVTTDFLVLGMPIPLIWRVRMRKRQKIQITAVFMIGSM